jgi:hypothetical protein
VPTYIDFVSARFGGGDMTYCGARTIGTFTPQVTYQNTLQMSAEDRQLIIGTTNNNDVGTYQFDLIDFIDVKEL